MVSNRLIEKGVVPLRSDSVNIRFFAGVPRTVFNCGYGLDCWTPCTKYCADNDSRGLAAYANRGR